MPATLIREKTIEQVAFAYDGPDELEDLKAFLGHRFDDVAPDGTVSYWTNDRRSYRDRLAPGEVLVDQGGWLDIIPADEIEEDFEAVYVP